MGKYTKPSFLNRATPALLALALGSISLYKLEGDDIKAFFKYDQIKQDYVSEADNTEITSIPDNLVIPEVTEEPEVTEPVITPEKTDTYLADNGYEFLNIDFNGLNEINSDVVGYLVMPGTNIDYPVLQGTDNDFYLHHNIDGTGSTPGSIFINSNVDLTLGDDSSTTQTNLISFYGHHMRDGAMFRDLKYYKEAEFVQEHPYGVYYTEDGDVYALEIVGVYVTSGTSSQYTFVKNLNNETVFNEYMDYVNENALVRTDVNPELGDKLVALITCSYEADNYREVVLCKAVKQELTKSLSR